VRIAVHSQESPIPKAQAMKALFLHRITSALVLVALLALLAPGTAWAYIDPGTGSFVLQGIIGAVVGGLLVLKLFWRRIKAKLTGQPLEEEKDLDD
jgi:Na+/proline symporter